MALDEPNLFLMGLHFAASMVEGQRFGKAERSGDGVGVRLMGCDNFGYHVFL